MGLVVRATLIYFFLWLIARGVGKRELSQLTAFELILLVIMGDLIQQGVTLEDTSLTGAIIVLSTLAFWVVVFAYLSWRFKATRTVFEGFPVVVVHNGEPVDEVLALERVTLDEVKEEARKAGIDDLSGVRIGVLEPDGKFSFLTSDTEQHQADEDSPAA
ncbi:MAG: DUF421 domain-containing protein [Acidimicrobiales bacterium]